MGIILANSLHHKLKKVDKGQIIMVLYTKILKGGNIMKIIKLQIQKKSKFNRVLLLLAELI